jgi:F-type H+-transporting ATPase subunit b
MESVLAQLGGLLLKALPTFLLVLVLHFYLKLVFFKPLQRVLEARYQATEGARKQAESTLQIAASKAAEYEKAMRAARAEVYAAQEQLHRELEEQRKNDVAAARGRAEQTVAEAKAALARDVEEARRSLAGDTEALAEQIARSILSGRAA